MTTLNRSFHELFREAFDRDAFLADLEHDEPLDLHQDAWQAADCVAEDWLSAPVWSLEDLLDQRPELSDAQAWAVLRRCQAEQDPACGVSRALVNAVADELFGADDERDSDLLAGYRDPSGANLVDFTADAGHWFDAEGPDFAAKLARSHSANSHE